MMAIKGVWRCILVIIGVWLDMMEIYHLMLQRSDLVDVQKTDTSRGWGFSVSKKQRPTSWETLDR